MFHTRELEAKPARMLRAGSAWVPFFFFYFLLFWFLLQGWGREGWFPSKDFLTHQVREMNR